MDTVSLTSVVVAVLALSLPTGAQVPEYQTNSPGFSVDVNGSLGTASAFAQVTGSALCNGGISPFIASINLDSNVSNNGFEIGVSEGPVPISSSLNGAVFSDGQVVNLDFFFPVSFFNGGTLASFQPFTAPMTIPVAIGAALSMHLQGAILNPAAPLGFTLSQATAVAVDVVSGVASLLGPNGANSSLAIDLTSPGTCWTPNGVPFYGTTYTTIHVMSNGRVRFDNGQGDFIPSLAKAQQSIFAGLWTGFDPAAGGSITTTHPANDLVVVSYSSVPYIFQGGVSSSSFSLTFNVAAGAITIAGLDGVEPVVGSVMPTFLGISPGNGASDPGAAGFALGASGGPSSSTDMIYDLSAALSVPGYPAAGGTMIQFTPVGGGYSWTSN